jgi:hypothetical protein
MEVPTHQRAHAERPRQDQAQSTRGIAKPRTACHISEATYFGSLPYPAREITTATEFDRLLGQSL